MTTDFIETERLKLRIVTPEIYESVFATNDESSIRHYFGINSDEGYQIEIEKYKSGLTSFQKSFLLFYLLVKESNKVIGWCGYHTWFLRHSRAELGYVVNFDDIKRKGYMKEALPYVLQYGFNKMELNRVEALVSPENTPSLKLLKSHGFTEEGLLREHYRKHDVLEDSIMFALLRKDYNHSL